LLFFLCFFGLQELTRSAARALSSLLGERVDGPGRDGPFDERAHPLRGGEEGGLGIVPSETEVYRFIRQMYKRTRMQPECVVMLVHYIEKLLRLSVGQVALTAHTWRRLLLAALIVADKARLLWTLSYSHWC
jgi:hypothetical protein